METPIFWTCPWNVSAQRSVRVVNTARKFINVDKHWIHFRPEKIKCSARHWSVKVLAQPFSIPGFGEMSVSEEIVYRTMKIS